LNWVEDPQDLFLKTCVIEFTKVSTAPAQSFQEELTSTLPCQGFLADKAGGFVLPKIAFLGTNP